jgi:mono/diheme cytochrome c family protein
MKNSQWPWLLAKSLIWALTLAGCSNSPDNSSPMTPTGGAGSGGATGTQIFGFEAYTLLNATDAPAGTAAPAIYTSSTCDTCHGAQGQGVEFLAPEIRHTPASYASFIVRNGRLDTKGKQSAMVKFPNAPSDMAKVVSDSELTAMVEWLNGLPRPTTGKGLYKDFCGNCHGPNDPSGGAVPVSIRGLKASDVSAKVRAGSGTDITMRAAFMPSFDEALLPAADLTLIQSYLGSI